MYDLLATFVNTNGVSFPGTKAVNSSGGGATDGTEFVKAMVDDIWGMFQALINYAGLTPNGNPEEAAAVSQILNSIKSMISEVTEISSNTTHEVKKWNKRSFVSIKSGCTALRLTGEAAVCNKSNRLLVYNNASANCVLDFGATASVDMITIIPTQYIEFGYNEDTTKFNIIKSNLPLVYTSISNYTATTTDGIDEVRIPHTKSTGLFIADLTTVQTQTNRQGRIENNGLGLTKIITGSNKLKFKDQLLSQFFLFQDGDYIDWESDGTVIKIKHCSSCIESGFYNRSNWTNAHIGFANFHYDTKSGGTGDMTGQKYVLASGVTGLILADSAPAGAAGIATVCFVTGTGLAVNDEVGTCGSGQTFAVNEGTGNNKNQDWDVTHNMGIYFNLIKTNFLYNATASYTNSQKIPMSIGSYLAGGHVGGVYESSIDANNIRLYADTDGISAGNGTNEFLLYSQDSYNNVIVEISA